MTLFKVDKHGQVQEVEKSVEERYTDSLLLEKATQLLDRKQKTADWREVDWPFECLYGNHLLVQISEFEYHGALEIPDDSKRDPTTGRVVMMGPLVDDIEIGQKVLYTQFAGYLLKFEGIPKCRILSREEILGRLKDNAPKLIAEGS